MSFLRIMQHLLPNARAWRLEADKRLRQFFEGISGAGGGARTFVDDVYTDLDPMRTRELDAWEQQFGMTRGGLSEARRRSRLAAVWQATGGQSPRYLQETLQGAGFNVFVHDWWEPGTNPPEVRSPLTLLAGGGVLVQVDAGDTESEAGEPFAEAGNFIGVRGYALVNNLQESGPAYTVLCGEPAAQCGEPRAQCGESNGFAITERQYILPTDAAKWRYFIYIGGEEFGTVATVPAARREEFETLCLSICPAHMWLGILVEYS